MSNNFIFCLCGTDHRGVTVLTKLSKTHELTVIRMSTRLKLAREHAGISRKVAAADLDIDPATLSRWESNHSARLPSASMLHHIAIYYRVPIDNLYPPRDDSPVNQQRIDTLKELTLQLQHINNESLAGLVTLLKGIQS